jgi:hypothetical protein
LAKNGVRIAPGSTSDTLMLSGALVMASDSV